MDRPVPGAGPFPLSGPARLRRTGGPREENPLLRRLSRLSNVMLAGPCPLVEVPDYLGRCQVLLDLLRDSQPYNDVVPPRGAERAVRSPSSYRPCDHSFCKQA